LLETLVNNLIIVLKNAQATEALKSAYEEVSSLNRAKDKLLNHLSHELRTPAALLKTAFRLLEKPLLQVPETSWRRIYDRAERSLARLSEIQCSAEDIVYKKQYRQVPFVSRLLDQCADVLETASMQVFENSDAAAQVRRRIDEIYLTEEKASQTIALSRFIQKKMGGWQPVFEQRRLNVEYNKKADPVIYIPEKILDTVLTALMKNAVENTPDQGKIAVSSALKNGDAEMTVQDFGVGIRPEHREYIFEGFYPTQEIDAYKTKEPFSFNAGGKGVDLLRLKIFSERYHFRLDMASSRCRALANASDQCPGDISRCEHCRRPEDCCASGFTTFRVLFPLA
jgi:signal transduction histidine kinase